MIGACDFCGCSHGECECDERHPSTVVEATKGAYVVESYEGFNAPEFFAQMVELKRRSPLVAMVLIQQVFRHYPPWLVPAIHDRHWYTCAGGVVVYR